MNLSKLEIFPPLFLRMIILFVLVSFFALPTFAQWTAPNSTAPNNNIAIPLNTSISNQIKEGPLSLNASNTSTYGLAILGRMGIGFSDPNNILSLFHITNGVTGASAYPTTVAPTVRIEGAGPALVTGPWSRIGIGTDNPQYPLDIPIRRGTDSPGMSDAQVSLKLDGLIRIIGGNPQQGYVLTSTDTSGTAYWQAPPSTGWLPPQYLNATDATENGLLGSANLSYTLSSNVMAGMWYVTVYGALPDWGNGDEHLTNIKLTSSDTTTLLDLPIYVGNHPDGTAPFSVSGIIHVSGPNGYIRVSPLSVRIGGPNDIKIPVINGITAYWLGV